MKRYLIIICLTLFGLSLGFAQSGKIIDDIYVTPNDAQMVNEMKAAKKAKAKERKESQPSAIYRNGAKEIVFIDQYGNKTTAVSDTVYIVDNEVYADSVVKEEGHYLNGFKGSKSDYEYAERIRRFHNPRYTITIADPGYDDIYFLDNNYWNVYMDGMYATITPTWNNPYYWNYMYSPFSYSSWAWRYNWGYPYWGSYYGWGGWYDPWYSPWYGGYYGWYGGWYNPWYSPWYSGYYGWGYSYYGWGYPYYGGYYGYPYYGGYYGYGYYNYNSNFDQANRRALSSSRYSATGLRSDNSRRSSVMSTQGRTNTTRDYTRVATSRNDRTIQGTRSGVARGVSSRSSTGIDTRTRTGAVRSAEDWNNVRSNRSYNTGTRSSGRSSIINHSNPSSSRRSSSYGTRSRSSSGSYSSPSRSSSSRSYGSGRSGSYSSPSRSSGSYGGSSGGSYGGGRSSSSGSSSSGGRR